MKKRFIDGGPSREAMTDSLRLDTEVQFKFNSSLTVLGTEGKWVRVVAMERIWKLCPDSWKIKFEYNYKRFDAFYSTANRIGFICNTDLRIFLTPVAPEEAPDYFPLSLNQLIILYHLKYIWRGSPLSNLIIKERLIRGIRGMTFPRPREGAVYRNMERMKSFLLYTPWRDRDDTDSILKLKEFMD
ncbi:MAG: hypothetical protein V4478_02820 [Patescibacteria group bacterium]